MKDLLKKMAQVANELDLQGLEKEANQVTMFSQLQILALNSIKKINQYLYKWLIILQIIQELML